MPRKPTYAVACDKTQQQIAEALGVHQPIVSRWLTGKDFPRYHNLRRLADAMGMSERDLADQIAAAAARRQSPG